MEITAPHTRGPLHADVAEADEDEVADAAGDSHRPRTAAPKLDFAAIYAASPLRKDLEVHALAALMPPPGTHFEKHVEAGGETTTTFFQVRSLSPPSPA